MSEKMKKLGGAVAFAAIFAIGALGVRSVYHDYVRGQEHAAKQADVRLAVDSLSRLIHPRQPAVTVDANEHLTSRVIDLPEDGNNWYLTVVTAPGDGVPLERWLMFNPRLARLKAETRFNHYTPDNPMYRERVCTWLNGAYPIVALQQADGQVVFKASGSTIPRSPDALADEIAASIASCPNCHPRPQPAPEPGPQPTPVVIPDIGPPVDQPQPDDEPSPFAAACAALLGGALLAGISALRNTANKLGG